MPLPSEWHNQCQVVPHWTATLIECTSGTIQRRCKLLRLGRPRRVSKTFMPNGGQCPMVGRARHRGQPPLQLAILDPDFRLNSTVLQWSADFFNILNHPNLL